MAEIKAMLLKEEFFYECIFEKYRGFLAQIKFNGVYAIIHIKNHKIVGIRNRNNNPILYLYPELEDVMFSFNEGILIAEIVVIKNGKSVFYSGIDQRRTRKHDKNNPVTAIIHDILKIDGKVTINLPYKERYALIKQNVANGDFIRVADNYEPETLWKMVIERDLEGLILKSPVAVYQIGVRTSDMVKIKNYKTIEVEVESVEENPKGTKVIGRTDINGENIEVEVQIGGQFNLVKGQRIPIKYLDIVGKRLIQATKA